MTVARSRAAAPAAPQPSRPRSHCGRAVYLDFASSASPLDGACGALSGLAFGGAASGSPCLGQGSLLPQDCARLRISGDAAGGGRVSAFLRGRVGGPGTLAVDHGGRLFPRKWAEGVELRVEAREGRSAPLFRRAECQHH